MTRFLPAVRRSVGVDAILLVLTFCTAGFVVAGFFGAALPLLDTVGQFRAHASAALVPLALALLARRFLLAGLASVLAAALGLQSVLPFILPSGEAGGALPPSIRRYSLLQMNVRFDTEDKAMVLKRIEDLLPDVVTIQEVTPAWEAAFAGIAADYPYQAYCMPPEQKGDVAILSRRPFVDGARQTCEPMAGFAARSVDFDGHPVTIGAQHLRWPWPGRQNRQVAELEPLLRRLAAPLLVGGDFNSAAWSASVRRYAEAGALRVVAGIGPTWGPNWFPSALARHAGLPIDNVLASSEILVLSVTRPEATSSDHLPVLVTFAIPFPRAREPDVQSVERRRLPLPLRASDPRHIVW